jgi:hypothetical protein
LRDLSYECGAHQSAGMKGEEREAVEHENRQCSILPACGCPAEWLTWSEMPNSSGKPLELGSFKPGAMTIAAARVGGDGRARTRGHVIRVESRAWIGIDGDQENLV